MHLFSLMVKKYIVALSAHERAYLEPFATMGRRAAEQITRARTLLKADYNQTSSSWLDKDIAAALDVGVATVERMRRRFVEWGLEASFQVWMGSSGAERMTRWAIVRAVEATLLAYECGTLDRCDRFLFDYIRALAADGLVEVKLSR
ncbi:MAG: hypothetical protein AAFQ89_08470 [Cyanobacteria bacterium J06626_18]